MGRPSRVSRVRCQARAGTAGTIGPRRPATIGPGRSAAVDAGRTGIGAVPGASAHRPVRSGHDPFPPGVARRASLRPRLPRTVAVVRRPRRRPRRLRGRDSRSCRFDPGVARARPTAASPAPTRISRRCCPRRYQGKAPDNVDSGRNCTTAALGSARRARASTASGSPGRRGPSAARPGSRSPCSRATASTPTKLLTFYEQSATADSHTEKLSTADVTVDGKAGRRLDVLGQQRRRADDRHLARGPARTRCSCCSRRDLGDAARDPRRSSELAGS